ncbi:MAG: hypothetical protein R2861_05290 [Desulfobacterales bacterium]
MKSGLSVKLPAPPETLPTLWQNDQRYIELILRGISSDITKTADAGIIDAEGYIYVMSRTDDIINAGQSAFHRAPWRKCWLITRWECAVLEWRTSSKARFPWDFWY